MKELQILLSILSFVMFNYSTFSQEPFSIPSFDPQKVDYTKTFFGDKIESEDSKNIDNLNVLNQGALGVEFNETLIPKLSFKVIQYRLGIFTNNDNEKYYLPFMLLSRFGLNSDSLNNSTISDALSFEGSPLVLRIMPSARIKIGRDNSLDIGLIADYRGITYRDSLDRSNLKYSHSFYGAFGFRYSGEGEVRDETMQNYKGKWSLSCLYNIFFSNKNSLGNLFINDGDLKLVSSLQVMLKFATIDAVASQLSFILSGQYLFNKPVDGERFILKLNFGAKL